MVVGLLMPALAGVCLSAFSLAQAQVLFSGISSVEARPSTDGQTQIIDFQADLPFQYQKQVLDHNNVLLRLYNARLAQSLITPEGGVNLLTADGAVQGAWLRTLTGSNSAEGVEEIILTGPGLGTKQIKILGAQEIVAQSKPASSTHVMMARIPTRRQGKSTVKKSMHLANLSNLKALAANGTIYDANHPSQYSSSALASSAVAYPAVAESPSRIEPEKAAYPVVLKPSTGPKIMEIRGPSSSSYAASSDSASSAESSADAGGTTAAGDEGQSQVYRSSGYQTEEKTQSQVTTPLPRYTGGAKPIEAMTTDNQGHPILIKPKSEPIPELTVGKPPNSGGYNALFQAEPEDVQQRIGLYLSDALAAYKANQFGMAQRQIQQALLLDASNADLLAALAEIQLKQGEISLAEQNYQKAQELDQDKYGVRYAQLLALKGKRKEAISILESLYRQDAKQVQVVYMLGTLNEELGQTGLALTYLQQAAQLHPASSDIQYNLGLAFELSGDREQAEKHYRQALGLSPKAPDIVKALARVRQGGV